MEKKRMDGKGSEKKGKVWLAGAGPGDAGLLTRKTVSLLKTADVVVYDALVSTEILSMIPDQTEMINVGKRRDHHLVPQEEINRILAEKAKEGKQVVRLKGGDPFVFGRGGEELEFLESERVLFEVVPGISSCTAVPAYAGIPVTHRDCASSFHVITGHMKKGKTPDIDYEALVRMNATLVFLMGVTALEEICENLIRFGMSPEMPAAVVSNGTCKDQKALTSTVALLPEKVKEAGIGAPAVIVVGKVCTYGERFQWIEKLPLGGRQYIVTRPGKQNERLAEQLRMLGARVIECSAISTEALQSEEERRKIREALYGIKERIESQETNEWIVFTSAVGVKEWFIFLDEEEMDVRSFWKAKFAVIGKGTAQELKHHGIRPDLIPEIYEAGELGKLLASCVKPGDHVTAFRAREASKELFPPIRDAKAICVDIPVYETITRMHAELKERICKLTREQQIDAVLFTSASTVRGFANIFTEEKEKQILSESFALCIGRKTQEEAMRFGMKANMSREATVDSMVEKLLENSLSK